MSQLTKLLPEYESILDVFSLASQQVRKVVVICVFTVGASFVILSGLVWGGSGVQVGLQDGMYVCVCVCVCVYMCVCVW